MKKGFNNSGFSLTEVLLAVGTLSIGMMFIGGTFMAGIYFSTIATERTIASVASDEAFAKVRLYGVNLALLPDTVCHDFNEVSLVKIDPNEFAYPSVRTGLAETQYFWSALCRLTEPDTPANPNPTPSVQVTVFVSRRAGSGMKYRSPDDPLNLNLAVAYPMPVPVAVSGTVGDNTLTIQDSDEINLINDGYTIVENATGRIYRVIERDPDHPEQITLDTFWQGGNSSVWVVPPGFDSGKYPCIAVYQKVIGF